MIVCFLFLGWAFYELSGGSDFEPEQRAEVETMPAPEPVVEVALDVTQTPEAPEAGTTSESIRERLATALVTPAVTQVLEDTPLADVPVEEVVSAALDVVSAPEVAEVVETLADVAEVIEPAPVDLRQVAGSRVNMRSGPSTDFSVLVTLDGGTTTEVIDRNEDGWVLVRVQDTGQEGWMAERLLEPVNG